MNVLSIIRARHQKAMRLHEAQLLQLKAYRGVAYTKAPTRSSNAGKELTYRGHHYTV